MPSVLKWALAVTAAMVVTVIGAWLLVATEIYAAVHSLISTLLALTGLPGTLSHPVSVVTSIALAAPVIKFTCKLLLGRQSMRSIATAAAVFLLALTGWLVLTRDWLFGLHGEPIAFVCPPAFPGGGIRVQRHQFDQYLGGKCEPVTRATAKRVLDLRNAQPLDAIAISDEAALRALKRFDADGPLLLAGAPSLEGDPPQLYRGRVGIDPVNGKWLAPATDDDIKRIVAYLHKKKESERLESAAAAAREASAATARATTPATDGQGFRADPNREGKRVDTHQELAAYVGSPALKTALSNSTRSAYSGDDEEHTMPLWHTYFVSAIDRQAPLVIVVGVADPHMKKNLSAQLSGGRWWDEDVLRGGAFKSKVAVPMLNNPFRAMSRDAFPPNLEHVIIASPAYQMSPGQWCVTVVRFDLRRWSAQKSGEVISI